MKMADTDVPVYVSALGDDGITTHLLVKKDTPIRVGRFYCTATAPNGLQSQGYVERICYDAIRALFKDHNQLGLAVDPGIFQPDGAGIPDVGLRLWSANGPVDWDQGWIESREGPPWGVAIAPPDDLPVNHVQIWSMDGAVTVTAWPSGGTLFPMPGRSNAQRRVRPIALGQDLECSAYWGFLRHTTSRAVRELGSQIFKRVASASSSEIIDDELIVAAHYLLISSPPVPDAIEAIMSRLAKSSSVDCAILHWAILHDGLAVSPEASFQGAFERAMLGLNRKGCRYTEVFRQLVRRLDSGGDVWRRQRKPFADKVEEAILWSARLAKATYWDAEYLTYRAIEPSLPDATAIAGQLPSDAKKKSGIIHCPY